VQLQQALRSAIDRLTAAHVGSPRMNAEVLLMFTLGCDRAYLYAHPERELTGDELDRYRAALAQRTRSVPAQYITGHQEFWGLDLIVSPAVLIPRPETEHVVETVLELARGERKNLRIIDVGTGSGCIALALAKELPDTEIHATDISVDALDVARANAARLQLERVHFRESDLLSAFPSAPQFDFIVSNPPYVGEKYAESVEAQVRRFEPHIAVFAGPEGLGVYQRLIPQARERLKPGGWLVLEIGYGMADHVCDLLRDWSTIQTRNDLQGITRVIAARMSR
jgi:release factor glutamine methyltransferase